MTACELIDLYLREPEPPAVIELSGGQPELVPEWTLWIMRELENRGLMGRVHLWTEDSLSCTFFWTHLSDRDIAYMLRFPLHSRVACFKGYSCRSFVANTGAPGGCFDSQFTIFREYLRAGFDMYAYAIFTGPVASDSEGQMREFVDRLVDIHPLLPLRTIPLRITPFAATRARMESRPSIERQLESQASLFACWALELRKRFSTAQLEIPYEDVLLR